MPRSPLPVTVFLAIVLRLPPLDWMPFWFVDSVLFTTGLPSLPRKTPRRLLAIVLFAMGFPPAGQSTTTPLARFHEIVFPVTFTPWEAASSTPFAWLFRIVFPSIVLSCEDPRERPCRESEIALPVIVFAWE